MKTLIFVAVIMCATQIIGCQSMCTPGSVGQASGSGGIYGVAVGAGLVVACGAGKLIGKITAPEIQKTEVPQAEVPQAEIAEDPKTEVVK